MSNTKKTTAILLIALALLAGFSGCSGGGGADAPTSIKITVSGIDSAKLPAGSKNFSLSIIPKTKTITVASDVSKLALMQTVLTGAISEGFQIELNTSSNFSLTFSMLKQFDVPDDYILILGASADMEKDPATSKGRMYITGSGTTTKKVVHISDGVTIPWSDFLYQNGTENGWTAPGLVTDFF